MSKSKHLRIGETVLGTFTLGVGLFIAIDAWLTPSSAALAVVGPGLFPGLIAAGLIIVGLQLFHEGFLRRFTAEDFPELDWKAVFIVAIAVASQVVLLERFGWIISGTAVFVVCAMAFGSRSHVRNVLFGLALTTITYAVFDYGLDLDLPTGSYIEDLLDPSAAA
ncbi:tripartite tricarboxylate transporter TctB family protein [Rhizobium leguminosarum]|uniref:tripartite tricarboxylate transporter TctB family protein n=1 Tax=Rhizobium leguminosarum TaxID=384 RepID=UPI000DE43A7E